MREILFRMYDGVKMVYDGLVIYDGELYEDWRAFEDGFESDNPLMQYTGLDDKNGVKIYEGDVLECEFGSEKFVVEFDIKTAQFTTKSNWLWSIVDRCEIIGNIHDNPELMGEKK